jgi:predicted metal-binding membrane protein
VTVVNIPIRQRPGRAPLVLRHPELGAVAAVGIAWAGLIGLAIQQALNPGLSSMAGMPNMPGMVMPRSAADPGSLSVASSGLRGWTLMCIAMMGPAAIAGVRHTALNSLRRRRARAIFEFALTYLGVWVVFGVGVLGVMALIPEPHGLTMFGVVTAVAAVWQLTPLKRRCLRDCHRSVPLPMRGWPADRGALRFGLRNGCACLGSCWCLMLVMAVAPGDELAWMGALTGIVTMERLLPRPRRSTRLAAFTLGAIALGAAVTAVV